MGHWGTGWPERAGRGDYSAAGVDRRRRQSPKEREDRTEGRGVGEEGKGGEIDRPRLQSCETSRRMKGI